MTGRGPRGLLGRAVAVGVAAVVLATGASCSTGEQAGCAPAAIAYMGPLTGPAAALGRPLRNGVAMAVADHNAAAASESASAPDRCPIGLVEFDTRGDPEHAVPIATQIVNQPDIVGVVGPSLSGEAAAALPVFEEAGLAVVTPSATNAELGTRGWDVFHRMVTTDATQGPAMARYLTAHLGLRRVAVIDDGSLYGAGVASLVASSLPSLGGQVAARRTIDPSSRDYTAAVDEVRSSGADAVFFGGTDDPGARLVRQLRERGVTVQFSAPDAVFTAAFITSAGAASEGALLSCPCAPAANGQRPSIRLFGARYEEAYGESPGPFAPESYDAGTLLVAVVDDVGPDRAAVLAALRGAQVDGVTRTVRFDDDGEVSEGPVYLYTVAGGQYLPVGEVVDDQVIPRAGG